MPKIKSKALRDRQKMLIQQAQQLYATGDYSTREVAKLIGRSNGWTHWAILQKVIPTPPLT